eukprot:CAMPEP_0172409764 /NCGR_PEP_ID=MMETSP1061-20121228/76536_1 /TAXON_ID=37318 /ORGANISM="Pseudo-nitzschia pungens, Strain cf. pungens" /LENGTH=423 /DNA_ID=CAMNT_0013145929 /DNA_START=73 /DNA_END=1344 /DNA_ORIENTATION=-
MSNNFCFCSLRSVLTTIAIAANLLSFRAHGLVNDSAACSSNKNPKICPSPELASISTVDVWNNVIDAEHLAPLLDEEARRIGLGHKVFSRSPEASSTDPKQQDQEHGKQNVIEQTLDSILKELNDDAKYVEYWTRREWRSIHAHADVDEYRAKEEQRRPESGSGETQPQTPSPLGGFRYPRNGHVLYLRVGTEVRGPTCIFPNRRSGGDLLRKTSALPTATGDGSCDAADGTESSVVDDNDANDNDDNDNTVELVTVPAVPGRLLRFRGDYLHAVPRPTDLWLLKFVKGSPTFEPEEEWGRSVVLFNTWSDEPPSGLPIDQADESLAQGDGDAPRVDPVCQDRSEWERVSPTRLQSPLSSSSSSSPSDPSEEPSLSAKVWLLGDYRRRDFRMQTVKLGATEALREALYQETDVVSSELTILPS